MVLVSNRRKSQSNDLFKTQVLIKTWIDHKNANNNIITPRDGKALQFGCLGGLPSFLKHLLPQESRCGKNGKSLQCQSVQRVWKLNHAIAKHDEGVDIAATYRFSRNDFPGAKDALKTKASLPNSQIARP